MKIKTTMRHYCTSIRISEMTTPNAGGDDTLEHSNTAHGDRKLYYTHSGRQCGGFFEN